MAAHPPLVLLRRRSPGQPVLTRLPTPSDSDGPAVTRRIRCPQCQWQPASSSRWSCAPVGPPEDYPLGCGTIWNTFNTGGQCPGCQHLWEWTSCLSCFEWSRHLDWYDESDEDN